MDNYKIRKTTSKVIYHVFTFLFAIVMIYPLLWMVMSSFKDTAEIFKTAEKLLPESFDIKNYVVGWQGFAGYKFSIFFKNSFVIAGLSTIGAVFSSAVVAFGFARCDFKLKGFLFGCMLITMILPFHVINIPQ